MHLTPKTTQHLEQSIHSTSSFPADLSFFSGRSMADIAMLVAEEHEKRLKMRGVAGAGVVAGEEASMGRVNFGAVTKVWGSWADSAAAAASGVKVHVALLVKSDDLVAEPKTPVALAAFNGFFSA